MNERPAFVTLGSTVSAAENIVNWLKAELEGEKQPDRVERWSVTSVSLTPRIRSKAICPGAAAVSVLRPYGSGISRTVAA